MFPRTLAARASAFLLLAGCSHPADDPGHAARDFFSAIVKGQVDEAYDATSFSFKALQSRGAFTVAVQDLGLIGAAVDSVEVTSTDPKIAKVKAIVTTAKGPQPFTVALQQDAGSWRVFTLKSPPASRSGVSENRFSSFGRTLAFSDISPQPPPDDRTVARLIRQSMNEFAQAISHRSFVNFYADVSKAWQSQLSETQLERAFQGFIDQDVNLTGVTDLSPVFDATPMVSTEGLLLVSGHYPTKPYEVIFVFKYVYENEEWKLFGLDVNLRQAPEAAGAAK